MFQPSGGALYPGFVKSKTTKLPKVKTRAQLVRNIHEL